MDIVVRGRSRQCHGTGPEAERDRCGARQDRTGGRGRTGAEPGRGGPEGEGGPVQYQAGEDQSGAGQGRTRGRGKTRAMPDRAGPEGVKGERDRRERLSTSVRQREPEVEDRVAATKVKPSRTSQPVMRANGRT